MPGMTPLRPDDVHSARAWAAFVAEDAAAGAPPSLEARVMRAAQQALAQKQRAETELAHRRWFAGMSALAASLLAAAAWSLAPGGLTASRTEAPAGAPGGTAPLATTPESSAAGATIVSSPIDLDEPPGRPVPMTNIEAGRVLRTPLPARLASRPLFDPAAGVGPVSAPGALRARSFGAAAVEPIAVARTHAPAIAPHAPAQEPAAAPSAPGALAGSAPETWSLRAKPVFDPDAVETAPPPPVYRLEHATPAATPRESPPVPPN
jgi:hypothetical protein